MKLETDVFATCFQRDSVKDQIIVYVFILGTLGLLVWAGVRPWVEVWYEVSLTLSLSLIRDDRC